MPNDASNQARALLVLQSAGLIELKSGGTIFSDLADIDEAKSAVKVTALEASLTPTSLPDVAAAVINNDFVADAGLSFEDAIAQDDPSDPNALPYVNIFAARAEDADNETYLKLVEIFQTDPEVQAALLEASGGTAVPVTTPVADLEESLAKVEADTEGRQGLIGPFRSIRTRAIGDRERVAAAGARQRPRRPSPRCGRSTHGAREPHRRHQVVPVA